MAFVVVTGGARSGKSRAAQQLAVSRAAHGQDVVVAVFAESSDAEMTERISRHQADRPEGFVVVEARGGTGWMDEIPAEALLVLDCLGTCLGREMLVAWDETDPDSSMTDAIELPEGLEEEFAARVDAMTHAILDRGGDTIIVTNEVGSGIVPTHATGRIFRDELGRANRRLIDAADATYLVVAGRVLDIGSLPRLIPWPND